VVETTNRERGREKWQKPGGKRLNFLPNLNLFSSCSGHEIHLYLVFNGAKYWPLIQLRRIPTVGSK
jgi:hypothetical protein